MKFTLFLSAVIFSFTASADVYFVDTVSSTQSESSLLSDIKKVIKDSFIKKDHIISDDSDSADWLIEPTLILDGNMYTLSVLKKSTKKTVYEDSLKAKTKDELIAAAEELVARSVLFSNDSLRKNAYEEQNKHMMYHFGKDTKNRFFAGLGFGGGDGIDEDDNQGFSLTLGYLRMLNRYVGAKLEADSLFLNSSDGISANLNIGLQFYPLKRKHSPYLSTMLGYSWTKSGVLFTDDSCTAICDELSGETNSGLGARAAIGYHFFRNLPRHFGVELYYSKAFYDILDQAPESFGGKLIFYWK